MDDGEILVHLARLALQGSQRDIVLYIRRITKKLRKTNPDLATTLDDLIQQAPTRSTPLRSVDTPSALPVDIESRLPLASFEASVQISVEPIFRDELAGRLHQIVEERRREHDLADADLMPTRSALLVGPPGVGKTLAARWLAKNLHRPLVTLDLSAVMSSFLGRTGNNLRNVLDYARSIDCILFLDEFDAVAKRRDDAIEVGELKRLVTVLLQAIDQWPHSGLLLAATNHPDLLDPAIWRRFDLILEFPMPTVEELGKAAARFLGESVEQAWHAIVGTTMSGTSFSDLERELMRAKRQAVLAREPVEAQLQRLVADHAGRLTSAERQSLAHRLMECGCSQRRAHELTGVSRDTIRKSVRAATD